MPDAVRLMGDAMRDFRSFADTQFFGANLMQVLPLLALVLSLGGVLARGPSAAHCLSLPVPRSRWVVAQAAVAGGLLLALSLAVSLLFVLLAGTRGHVYPLGPALGFGLAAGAAAWPWVAVTLAATALCRDVPRALALSLALMLGLAGASLFVPLGPWSVADPLAWRQGVPWPGLAWLLLMCGSGLAFAVARAERVEA